MKRVLSILALLLAPLTLPAQTSSELANALQKLDVKVFTPDMPEAKLRTAGLQKRREAINRQDVENWKALRTRDEWEKFRDERLAALRRSLGQFPDPPAKVKVMTT